MKDLDEFIIAVVEMRMAQKDYFRTRLPCDLGKAKHYEKEVDAYLRINRDDIHQKELM